MTYRKAVLVILFLMAATIQSWGSNFYVHKGASGKADGSDWTNAWTDFDRIDYSKIACGDTIWIAGAVYSSTLTPSKSCTSGSPLRIYRATSSDSAAGSAAGWNSSFDSQVQIKADPGIDDPGSSSVTIDGRFRAPSTNYGIKVIIPGGGGNGVKAAESNSVDGLKLYNIEVLGPYCTTSKPCSSAAYGINIAPSNNNVTNLLVNSCFVHGVSEAFRSSQWNGVIIEYNQIADTYNDGVDHEDVEYSYPSNNVTWRYNTIHNSPNDGIFFEFGGAVNFYLYGNVYYDSQYSLLTTKAPGNYGPIYIYNNTFHAPSSSNYGWITSDGSNIDSRSRVYNNVFYNVSNDLQGATSAHNGYSYTTLNGYGWPSNEVGSFTFKDTGANVFVNLSGGDFHLVSGSPLIDKGVALATDGYLNKDASGVTRGNGGGWDVGAFEYSGVTPGAPVNLQGVVH